MNQIIVTVILLPVVIMVLFASTVLYFDLLDPYIYYTKISDISRQFLVSIEDSGGLTAEEEENILDTMEGRGIQRSLVTIDSSPEAGETADYGNPISITITYNLKLRILRVNSNTTGFSFGKQEKVIPIKISKTGISKLAGN